MLKIEIKYSPEKTLSENFFGAISHKDGYKKVNCV